MSSPSPLSPRQVKVNLADYLFRRDIEVRLFMAQLNAREIEVLREIIHHSLIISIEQLAEDMKMEVDTLLPILDKLSVTKLFKRQQLTLRVDKEMRKYFENKLERFDLDFRPDLDFLQIILSKVPIHILPLWYAIPRSSDNIFESIIEKYFSTPKTYRQYIHELEFEDPVINAIIQEVHRPPHFRIPVADLMTKLHLTHELLEEYLLLLEYYFICCLSYQRIGDQWQEIVTPFAEWKEYLRFEFQTHPRPIPPELVDKHQQEEFQLIKDFMTFLQSKKAWLKKNVKISLKTISKLIQLEFAMENSRGQLIATKKGQAWMLKPLFEQVTTLANDPDNTLSCLDRCSSLWNARNLRLIEKSLRRLVPYEWVEFRQFLQGFIAPIGEREPVTLKTQGKKWKYALPIYTSQEEQFIQAVIMERLAELGIVQTGSFQSHPCFCLTSFGQHYIQ
jgi:hypothetical protein